jgi:hypothetical protein
MEYEKDSENLLIALLQKFAHYGANKKSKKIPPAPPQVRPSIKIGSIKPAQYA